MITFFQAPGLLLARREKPVPSGVLEGGYTGVSGGLAVSTTQKFEKDPEILKNRQSGDSYSNGDRRLSEMAGAFGTLFLVEVSLRCLRK